MRTESALACLYMTDLCSAFGFDEVRQVLEALRRAEQDCGESTTGRPMWSVAVDAVFHRKSVLRPMRPFHAYNWYELLSHCSVKTSIQTLRDGNRCLQGEGQTAFTVCGMWWKVWYFAEGAHGICFSLPVLTDG